MFVVLLMMAPPSQELEPPAIPGRFNIGTGEWIWSEELYRIFGVDPKSFRPSRDAIAELTHPDDRQRLSEAMDMVFQGASPPADEYRIIRPDGVVRTLYREVDLLRNEDGVVTGAIVTKRDITEQKLAEQAQERLEQELLHVQRIDALGRLAGGIAHDLNNTLVPVVALTDTVARNLPQDSPDVELLEIVRDAGTRARDLVKQILAFSRQQPHDMRLVELAPFVTDTLRFVRATIPTTINIISSIEAVPMLRADLAQLHQVILNLVGNAADAIGLETGTITVQLTSAVPFPAAVTAPFSSRCVRLSVIDTGCGMDAATKKRIFEPFFTTKDVDRGTGLGLSVVYGIVRGHGGSIEVSSERGRGTRFDIFFPLPDSAPSNQ